MSATIKAELTDTLPAAGDLSGRQYRFMVLNSSGQITTATAGLGADYVLGDKPDAAGKPGIVYRGGRVPCVGGAAFDAGVSIAVGTDGKAAAAGSGDVVVGTSISACTGDGAVFELEFRPA